MVKTPRQTTKHKISQSRLALKRPVVVRQVLVKKPTVWWVYMIQSSKTGIIYTGITTDIQRRLRQHNGQMVRGGAKCTRSGRPWILRYTEGPMGTRSEASHREYVIKQLSRKKKIVLFNVEY